MEQIVIRMSKSRDKSQERGKVSYEAGVGNPDCCQIYYMPTCRVLYIDG